MGQKGGGLGSWCFTAAFNSKKIWRNSSSAHRWHNSSSVGLWFSCFPRPTPLFYILPPLFPPQPHPSTSCAFALLGSFGWWTCAVQRRTVLHCSIAAVNLCSAPALLQKRRPFYDCKQHYRYMSVELHRRFVHNTVWEIQACFWFFHLTAWMLTSWNAKFKELTWTYDVGKQRLKIPLWSHFDLFSKCSLCSFNYHYALF